MKNLKRGVVHITDGPCAPCTVVSILLLVSMPLMFWAVKEYRVQVPTSQTISVHENAVERPPTDFVQADNSPESSPQGSIPSHSSLHTMTLRTAP